MIMADPGVSAAAYLVDGTRVNVGGGGDAALAACAQRPQQKGLAPYVCESCMWFVEILDQNVDVNGKIKSRTVEAVHLRHSKHSDAPAKTRRKSPASSSRWLGGFPKCLMSDSVYSQSPLDLIPATILGYALSSRSIRVWLMGTPATGGM